MHAYDMDGLRRLTDRLAEAGVNVPVAMGESVLRICSRTGGVPFLNAVLGTLYPENGLIEYHQPIMEALVPYMERMPEAKEGRFYLPDEPGTPMRMNFERFKKDRLLKEIVYRYVYRYAAAQ